jgi:SNF2 family DNA or RNA helicase
VPATIYGELTSDRQDIILIAAGRDYEVAYAARLAQTLTPLIKPTDPPGALRMPASWPAVVQLATTFAPNWRPGPALVAWSTEQVQARMPPQYELLVPPPAGRTPRSYQVEAACMIRETGSALIFDEPGCGKTYETVLGLVERSAAGHPVLPIVVVCPAAVIDTWLGEFKAGAPQWRAVAWRGTPQQRRRLVGTADIYVTSYDTCRRDAKVANIRKEGSALFLLMAQTIICDEVHRVKNHTSAQSWAVRRLAERAQNFIGLSGTPITHHPADLWPALKCLEPGAWPSRERWVERYCLSIPGDYGTQVLGLNPTAESEFRTTLLGRNRRVAKADVLTELPPKIYSVRTVDLPPDWRKSYDQFEASMLAELPDGQELSVMAVLAQINFLAMLASGPADVEVEKESVWDPELGMEVEKSHTHVHLKAPSWKVEALLEVLAERPDQQVVAFAPYAQLVRLAGEAAAAEGYKVGYIIGTLDDGRQQKAKDRTAGIDAFQRGELDLMCVTTGAGGVGITLTAARTAVFLQRPYSLVEALQAEDRLHRIGAERHDSVEIIDLVAKKTIDSRIRAILKERAGQLSELVQDSRVVAELLGGAGVRDLRTKRKAS